MKKRTRKIISRIGAGLMLGMSLFNFGAIWTRQQGSEVPLRVKNIKKEEKENLDQEARTIASIAERHANDVIMSEINQFETDEEAENKQIRQQSGAEESTIFQQMLRYGVIAVWTVSLGIIFSSVLLDSPISLGNEMLALIPGKTNVATIYLEPQKSFFQENEEAVVNVFVETKTKNIKSVELAVKFDPKTLEFEAFKEEEGLGSAEVKKVDEEIGVVNVVLKEISTEKSFEKKQKIASIKFSGKATANVQEVSILKSESSVVGRILLKDEFRSINLLEKIQNAKFSIIGGSGKKIKCGTLEGDFSKKSVTMNDWEQVLSETKLPENALIWQEVGDETYFLCSVDREENLHLLVKRRDVLKKVDLFMQNKKIKNFQEDNWQEEDVIFYSLSYDLEGSLEASSCFKELMLRFDGNLNWPKKGLAELGM